MKHCYDHSDEVVQLRYITLHALKTNQSNSKCGHCSETARVIKCRPETLYISQSSFEKAKYTISSSMNSAALGFVPLSQKNKKLLKTKKDKAKKKEAREEVRQRKLFEDLSERTGLSVEDVSLNFHY